MRSDEKPTRSKGSSKEESKGTAPDMLLTELELIFVDVQTSGASPARGQIIEVAWRRLGGETQGRLVSLRPEEELPRRISRLTGIDAEMLTGATDEAQVLAELMEVFTRPLMAHYARFEASFLKELLHRFEPERAPWRFLCTHELARRLFPELPRRGLRALSGFLGFPLPPGKRAGDHVDATVMIWEALLPHLAAREITTLGQLEELLRQKAPKPAGKRFPLPRAERLALPDVPGIYQMLDAKGRVLYVGKATSLKKRVNSYYQKRKSSRRQVFELLVQVHEIAVEETSSPVHAALVEHDLIKSTAPLYNIALQANERELVYLNHALEPVHEPPWLGPVPSAQLTLQRALLSGREAELEGVAEVLSQWREGCNVEMITSALEEIWEGCSGGNLQQQLQHAARRWEAILEEEAAQDALEEAPERSPEWDLPRMTRQLGHALSQLAQSLRRARWLALLYHSQLSWSEGEARVGVQIKAGALQAAWGAGEAPPRFAPPPFESHPAMDLNTFDRLRVLSTEILTLVRQARAPLLKVATGRALSNAMLSAFLGRGAG